MFLTIKEFWLKWRLRVAEERIQLNTRARKQLIKSHARQVEKAESIKERLRGL